MCGEINVKIAIVEDNMEQAKVLKKYLERFAVEQGECFEISIFPNAVEFISDYRFNFDLIFMDIQMPDLDGMRAAEKLRKIDEKVALVFVTYMGQYAVKGYEVSALYFLLKPVSYFEFSVKMEHVVEYVKKNMYGYSIIVSVDGVKKKIMSNDIYYIEVYDHNLVYHMKKETLSVRGSLSELERKLQPFGFIRVSACCMINLKYVDEIRKNSVVVKGEELAVSRSRKKVLMTKLADDINV